MMRKLCWLLLILLLVSCSARKKPVDPILQPEAPAPAAEESEDAAPEPAPEPAPVEPVAPPQPPRPKPRQPAKGDAASIKLVESGVKKMNAGDLESAEPLFEQALRISPTNGKPYYYLGVLAAKQKNYERSLGFLGQAEIYLQDDDFWMSQILLQEGLCLKALGEKDAARAKLQEALRRDPANQWAQAELNKL